MRRRGTKRGFTIIEIMVVVAIIAILMGVAGFVASDAAKAGRDAKRKSDLRTVEAALEAYRQENGRYPEACNGTGWSGGPGTGYECAGLGEEYIEGLAPNYIAALPRDPRPDPEATYSGYVYRTNADGTVYKFMALDSIEAQTVVVSNNPSAARNMEFARCGNFNNSTNLCYRVVSSYNDTCGRNATCATASYPGLCNDPDTYAVYGGYADGQYDQEVEHLTEQIVCEK